MSAAEILALPEFAAPPPFDTRGIDLSMPTEAVRAALVKQGKAYLTQARLEAESLLFDKGGAICARYLSDAQDVLIAGLHATLAPRFKTVRHEDAVAVAAMGGYGRGTLAPGSDIDILFVYRQASPTNAKLAEAMLYPLWDMGLKVGHATRTIDESIAGAKEDLTIRTALLEARLIAGEATVFEQFRARFVSDVMTGTAAAFAQAKLAEREERLKRAGGSRYLVEPNVKEGKGGLRDLNTLFWIGKYITQSLHPKDLIKAGIFTQREFTMFENCEEFLWRVRCHLHFVAGRAEERLSFDLQRAVAERMGYRGNRTASPVERFMKHYFLVAKEVGDLTNIVCAALEAREAKPIAMLDRFMGRFRRTRKTLSGEPDFVIENGRLTTIDADVFIRKPINLIRIFWLADRDRIALHPAAYHLISRSLRLIDAGLRQDREANRLFLDLLTSENAPEIVLRRMHEAGVLGRFVPEFGRIQAMMQFSMYHHYTVDEHTLRAIGTFHDLAQGRLKSELPLTTELLPAIKHKRVIQVALFLHDIGKGRVEDHSIAGARIARTLCPRFGLTGGETELVAWLIEHHLLMSVTSQTRDIGDPRTIRTFASTVQTLENLRLLLALTVCDIRAVGPGVWNGWKGQLLRALYWETEVELAGGHSTVDRAARVEGAKEALRARLPHFSEEEFAAFAERHYPAYWLKVESKRQAKHAELLSATARSGERFVTATATDAFSGVTELTIFAIDHPRLLAILTGACAAAGANIVSAEIFTTTDGHALDTIFVSRAFEADADEIRRADRIAQHMVKALKGEIALPEAVAVRASQQKGPEAFVVTPRVTVDNDLSAKYSVIEITGLDRPGLLYQLTTVLGKLNLNIASARITTYGEKVVDVFYVTDLTGGKLLEPARKAMVIKRLMEALGP
jgi:[protein-PII] uridylyltransferase